MEWKNGISSILAQYVRLRYASHDLSESGVPVDHLSMATPASRVVSILLRMSKFAEI
jgi:hypothetical protein